MEQNLTERAFEAFVRSDGQRLRRVMSSQYGVDIGCEATDAALAWAWEHWDRLRAMSNPAGYLYRVAQTHARRAVGRGRPVTFPPEPVSITDSRPSIDGDLADALRQLPDHQRLAVLMVHVYGWTPIEVGRITGTPGVTVRSHLRRGLPPQEFPLERHHIMSRTTPTLEDRLARYQPALDDAIADWTANPASINRDSHLIDLDLRPIDADRSRNRSRAIVVGSAAVLIGGLAVIVATRHDPSTIPASASTPTGASDPSNASVPADTTPVLQGTPPDGVVIDTAPATTIEGSGLTPPCPAGTDTIGTGTLYLGGPASEQNLAAHGFLFSLPTGSTAVDVAMRAIALPVIGQECSISAAPTPDAGTVIVTVDPPATPASLRFTVDVAERDGTIGVTGITGTTSFETNRTGDRTTLTLSDRVPATATRIQVRFKKGDDVWELTADTTLGAAITLAVPSGETDRFPDEPIDWVLFTAIDSNEHVVDAGGAVI